MEAAELVMKILLVGYTVPQSGVRGMGLGISRYIYYIGKEMREMGHDVELIVRDDFKPKENWIKTAHAPKFAWYPYPFYLRRQLKNKQADVFNSDYVVTGAPLAWLNKRPLVVAVHDALPFQYDRRELTIKDRMFVRFFKMCFNSCKKKADAFVVRSESAREEILKSTDLDDDKVFVVSGGIDPKFFYPTKKKPHDKIRIGYKGGLDGRKNAKLLVEIFRRMVKERDDIELHVAGAGANLEKFRRMNIPNAKFYGYIPIEKENEFLNSLDIFVYPTLGEGLGLPPCLPPNIRIVTNEGLTPISEIKKGTKVLTHEGRFGTVVKTFKRNYRGKIIKITPYSLNEPIKLTPEHPVLAFKRPKKKYKKGRLWAEQKPTWISAEFLEKGDCVIFPRYGFGASNTSYFDLSSFDNVIYDRKYVWYKMGYSPKTGELLKINRKIRLSRKLARLIGFYISEGSTSKSDFSHIEFSFGSKDRIYAQEVERNIKSIFGAVANAIYSRNKIRVIVSGTIIAKFFSKLCGLGAKNKRIPFEILYGDKEILKETLNAIHIGDGNVYKGTSSISTISRQLSNDLIIAFIRLGLKPHRKSNRRKDKKSLEYSINFSLSNTKPYSHSNKSWFLEDGTGFAVLIKDVKKTLYKGQVYNLEVNEGNSYCTESFVVHNCEAMACGIPVLASNTTSMPEIVGGAGIITEPTVESFYKELWKLVEDARLRKKIAARCLKRAKTMTWKRAAEDSLEIYEAVV